MWSRVVALLRARFSGRGDASFLPVGVWLTHGAIAAALCDTAREVLPLPYYGAFALTLSGALVAIPLLGEFGAFLRADPAAEWIEAMPVRPFELRLVRTLLLLCAVLVVSLGSLLPAAWLAQASAPARIALFAGGIAQTLCIAALLLGVQTLLAGRAESGLVLLQTVLVCSVVVGSVLGLRNLPHWLELAQSRQQDVLFLYPPAWFAAGLSGATARWLSALVAAILAMLAILLLPAPRKLLPSARSSLLERLLHPARALATAVWVRPQERPVFDLVYSALPREREFALRAYPLLAIPLAFFLAGARAQPLRESLIALILFLPAAYMPVLLTQIAGSSSHRARWLLETAPIDASAIAGGAQKALVVRLAVPLYLALSLLVWQLAGAELLARFALPGLLACACVVKLGYGVFVEGLPLSRPHEELAARLNWSEAFLAIAFVVTLLALAAAYFLVTPLRGLLASACLATFLAYAPGGSPRTAHKTQRTA